MCFNLYLQNFDQRKFAKCPFNARHVVPKREFDDHLKHCPDRVSEYAEVHDLILSPAHV